MERKIGSPYIVVSFPASLWRPSPEEKSTGRIMRYVSPFVSMSCQIDLWIDFLCLLGGERTSALLSLYAVGFSTRSVSSNPMNFPRLYSPTSFPTLCLFPNRRISLSRVSPFMASVNGKLSLKTMILAHVYVSIQQDNIASLSLTT